MHQEKERQGLESMEKGRRVLILDGDQRSALAATRSLGRKGVGVAVGSPFPVCLAGESKYCIKTVIYRSPTETISGFVEDVAGAVEKHGIDTLLPMTDASSCSLDPHDLIQFPRPTESGTVFKSFAMPSPRPPPSFSRSSNSQI